MGSGVSIDAHAMARSTLATWLRQSSTTESDSGRRAQSRPAPARHHIAMSVDRWHCVVMKDAATYEPFRGPSRAQRLAPRGTAWLLLRAAQATRAAPNYRQTRNHTRALAVLATSPVSLCGEDLSPLTTKGIATYSSAGAKPVFAHGDVIPKRYRYIRSMSLISCRETCRLYQGVGVSPLHIARSSKSGVLHSDASL